MDPLEVEYRNRLAAGDALFLDSHLVAWREALGHYHLAFAARDSDGARERLLLTAFLVLLRETQEGIHSAEQADALTQLCSLARSEVQRRRCSIARNGFRLDEEDLGQALLAEQAWPKTEDLNPYLELTLQQRSGGLADHSLLQEFAERYEGSPLAMYVTLREGFLTDSDGSYQRFAERFAYRGEAQLGEADYRNALDTLASAVDLVPDYSKVLNLLGNLYLFTLQNYKASLENFEAVLRFDPVNPTALFGKGLSLFSQGELPFAQIAFDTLILGTSVRWSDLDEGVRDYYQGQSRYYKAYIHYLIGEYAEARKWVDEAIELQPQAQGIRYLSGLLYWLENDRTRAEQEFLEVTRNTTSICDAYFRLGLIYRENEKEAADYFLSCTFCLEQNLDRGRQEMEEALMLDLDPDDQDVLRASLKAQINEAKTSGRETVGTMLGIMGGMKEESIKQYVLALETTLERLRLP